MKNRVQQLFGGIFCLTLVGSYLGAIAWAADFPQRKASANRSAKEGLGRPDLPLLKRKPGPGSQVVADMLLRRFARSTIPVTTRGTPKRTSHRDRLRINGNGWSLTVHGDGTQARYRNYAYLDGNKQLARPVSERLPEAKLEALGRQFIRDYLQDLVRLGPNEELVPFFTEFQIGGGGSTKEGVAPIKEQVLANTVVFTRSVNGSDVVGAGSKIAIIFANDEKPIGFDFDWPVYEPAEKTQKVLPLPDIQKRAREVAKAKLDAPNVQVKRFECGYFDPGARRRDPAAPVQAGCVIQSVERRIVDEAAHSKDPDSGHVLIAIVDSIPAGVVVERDERWPEAAKVLGLTPPARGVVPSPRRLIRPQ